VSNDAKNIVVFWAGRFNSPSGYGFATRSYVDALERAGLKVVCFDIELMELVGPSVGVAVRTEMQDNTVVLHCGGQETALLVVVHDIPDKFPRFQAAGRARRIGYTVFETGSFPAAWLEHLAGMDEVWTASEFNRRTFTSGGLAPDSITVVPHCLDVGNYHARLRPLRLRGLKDFVFLSVVSNCNRKDLGLLLRSYFKTFNAADDVSLILKTTAAFSDFQFNRFCRRAVEPEFDIDDPALPHVYHLNRTLSPERMRNLYATCDVYVTTERGKGWDIPAMEAMALGRPVVGIDWGGSTEFMNAENAFLVAPGPNMVYVEPDLVTSHELYTAHKWPEVSEESVCEQLRSAYADADRRAAKGAAAREYIRSHFNLDVVGSLMKKHIETIEFPETGPNQVIIERGGEREELEMRRLVLECHRRSILRPLKKYRAYRKMADYIEQNRRVARSRSPLLRLACRCVRTPKRRLLKKYLYFRCAAALAEETHGDFGGADPGEPAARRVGETKDRDDVDP